MIYFKHCGWTVKYTCPYCFRQAPFLLTCTIKSPFPLQPVTTIPLWKYKEAWILFCFWSVFPWWIVCLCGWYAINFGPASLFFTVYDRWIPGLLCSKTYQCLPWEWYLGKVLPKCRLLFQNLSTISWSYLQGEHSWKWCL